MNKETMISPSLLSADFTKLGEEMEMINSSVADWLHMDIMDGVFVPNISFGMPVVKAVHAICKKPLDVHMMTVHPENYIRQMADIGTSLLTIHAEACTHLHRTIQEIHATGIKAGVALNPATPLAMAEEILSDIDVVLIMSVNPGFSGQTFITSAIDKVFRLRQMIDHIENKPLIEVDGGVNEKTASALINAGADVLVSGSYIFSSKEPIATIQSLKNQQQSV